MSRLVLEPATLTTPRASVTVASPAPGIYCTVVTGHAGVEIGRRIIEAGDQVVAEAGMLVGFHDWEAMTGYETQCRVALTEWGVRIAKKVERVHLLVRSRIVAMGVSVASLVLGGMLVSYTDRRAFEAAKRERVKQAAGGSPPPAR